MHASLEPSRPDDGPMKRKGLEQSVVHLRQQMAALMSRTMTRVSRRSTDVEVRESATTIATRDRDAADPIDNQPQRRPSAANSVLTSMMSTHMNSRDETSSSSEDDEPDETASAVSGERDRSPLSFSPDVAKSRNRLREISLSDLSLAAVDLTIVNGARQIGTSLEVGADAALWVPPAECRDEEGKMAANRVQDHSEEHKTQHEQRVEGRDALESPEKKNAACGLDPSFTGRRQNEGANPLPVQWRDFGGEGFHSEDDELRESKRDHEIGSVKPGEYVGQVGDYVGASVWGIVKDVFNQDENDDATDATSRLPSPDGMASRARHTQSCGALSDSNDVQSGSDYGPLVGLQALNASCGEARAIVEEERAEAPRIHVYMQTEAGWEPGLRHAENEINSQRLDAMERQREVEYRELQALRKEVQDLKRPRQHETHHMDTDMRVRESTSQGAEEVAHLRGQETQWSQSWRWCAPEETKGRKRLEQLRGRDNIRNLHTKGSASRVASAFDHFLGVTNGGRGRGSVLRVDDLHGVHSDGCAPKAVLRLCKQLDKEAKRHLASLKSVATESRRAAAKHARDESELHRRIDELERLLHAAIESSCSKEAMTRSYHVLRSMESQRMRVVEAETQCRVTSEMLVSIKKELQSLRQDHNNAQAGLAAALADVAASSEEASEHYAIAQRTLADASALRDELTKAGADNEILQEKLKGVEREAATSREELRAAEERARKAEHECKAALQVAAAAEERAVSKSILAAAATKKLQMLGVSVPDTDAAAPSAPAHSRRKQFWQVVGEEDALPAPTTFLREADICDQDASEAPGSQCQALSSNMILTSLDGNEPAAESESGGEEAAPWVLRARGQVAFSLESHEDGVESQERRSHSEKSQKPLARGLYSKLFASKKRQAPGGMGHTQVQEEKNEGTSVVAEETNEVIVSVQPAPREAVCDDG